MTNSQFNSKIFNPEAFAAYQEALPHPHKDSLIKSGVIVGDPMIRTLLGTQTGSYFAKLPITGRIDGEELNYDGETDITATGLGTFSQGIIAFGRAKAWTEKDFSWDITAGKDFMDEVSKQVATYWDHKDCVRLIKLVNCLFQMSGGAKDTEFTTGHTYDISAEVDNEVTPTTLNTAVQKACGDKRDQFTMVFMHSTVATNLENQNVLKFLTQTDANGMTRDLRMATWNGRLVIVDDGMPYDAEKGTYTTYIFGNGCFKFEELGAKVPYEMSRDAAKNGGEDTLYTRRRMCIVPRGISFIGDDKIESLSPTDAELCNPAHWTLVNNGKSGDELQVFDHKDIPMARIISKG